MTDTSSSVWRTAYISTLFEKDAVKLAVGILEALSAINERLNGPVEISAPNTRPLKSLNKHLGA